MWQPGLGEERGHSRPLGRNKIQDEKWQIIKEVEGRVSKQLEPWSLCPGGFGPGHMSSGKAGKGPRSLTHHAKESGLYPEGSGELGRVGGQKRLGQLCVLERTLAGQRIEKHRRLSKQNEVRDDSRVAQIQRYQE